MKWNPALSVGIKELDDQHRDVMKHWNHFDSAMKSGSGDDAVREFVIYLDGFARIHFRQEEVCMERHGYPELEAHCQEHKEFLDQVQDFNHRLLEKKSALSFRQDLIRFFRNYIQLHIGHTDQRMVTFLKDKARTNSGRILIIEDIPMIREMLKQQTIALGYETSAACDGQVGLAMIRDWRPDLVLCDLMMPVMNGIQFLEAIRRDPELKSLPVIMTTSLNDHDSVLGCVTRGAVDYLIKPVRLGLLKSRLEILLPPHRT